MTDSGDWLVCPRAIDSLSQLEDHLAAAVGADSSTRAVATWLVARPGKRFRPALLVLSAQFGAKYPEETLLRAAAALELIHIASLYHDDVMDRALVRRKGPSVNSAWGNAMATAGGTFLFARASGLLAALGDEVNRLASAAVVRMCTGQLREVEHAYNVDLTEEEHLEVLSAKTATLFELPCRLGAVLSALGDDRASALMEYARQLGLAFQLVDDALDLSGDATVLGKATLTDIREGVYSLPVLTALRRWNESARLRDLLLRARLAPDELQQVVRLVQGSGAVDIALARARALSQAAVNALDEFAPDPAIDSLRRLAHFLVHRSH